MHQDSSSHGTRHWRPKGDAASVHHPSPMTDPPMMDPPMMDPPMMDPPTHGHGKKEKQRERRHCVPKITEEEEKEASSHGMRDDVFDVTMLESALPLSPPLPTGKGLGEEEADGSIAGTEMSEVEAKRLARKEEKARRKEEKRKSMFTHQTPQQHP
jgi:hypothetical protein